MTITVESHGITFTVEGDGGEDIDTMYYIFRGLLYQMGYSHETIEQYLPEELS